MTAHLAVVAAPFAAYLMHHFDPRHQPHKENSWTTMLVLRPRSVKQ